MAGSTGASADHALLHAMVTMEGDVKQERDGPSAGARCHDTRDGQHASPCLGNSLKPQKMQGGLIATLVFAIVSETLLEWQWQGEQWERVE